MYRWSVGFGAHAQDIVMVMYLRVGCALLCLPANGGGPEDAGMCGMGGQLNRDSEIGACGTQLVSLRAE